MSKGLGSAAYRPVSLLMGMGAGLVAGALFRRIWGMAAHGDAPSATDEDRGWGEVLAAAALQGVIFAVVRAAVDRGGAVGVRRITGRWPT